MPADHVNHARHPSLAAEMRLVLARLYRRLRAESATDDDLTWSQKAVLLRLEVGEPATVSTLARAEGVRPQSMGATIAALQAAGLIDGTPDPADRRQTLLGLTPACLTLIQSGRAARQDWLHGAIVSKLSPDEEDELARALRLLARLVD